MNRKIILIVLVLALIGCKRDCKTKVIEMQMKPIVTYETSQSAFVEGRNYYISQFQKESINFLINFVQQGAGEFCEFEWISYPVENGMRIINHEEIILNNDTIPPNSILNDYFKIEQIGEYYTLQYLIVSKATVPDSGIYQFKGELELDDGTFLHDSVIVKMK